MRGYCSTIFAAASLILTASLLEAGELRDGSWWTQLNAAQKETWTVGWMDGAAAGHHIAANGTAYDACIVKLAGMDAAQIVQGMDQFYAADFRNLIIGAQDVALLVAMYARGLDDKAALAMAADLREKYKRLVIAH